MEVWMRTLVGLFLFLCTPALAGGDSAAGEVAYQGNCSVCHGKAADGKGAAAMAMNPKPTDFTDATWWAGKTDDEVEAIIKNGKPSSPMNGFAFLGDAEIANIIAFLKTKKPAE
jgi:high-affinity iron transporter